MKDEIYPKCFGSYKSILCYDVLNCYWNKKCEIKQAVRIVKETCEKII